MQVVGPPLVTSADNEWKKICEQKIKGLCRLPLSKVEENKTFEDALQ